VVESWYPVLIKERSTRHGVNGAGAHRSGGGALIKLQPYGTSKLEGQMLGIREWLPLEGASGGYPGSTSVYEITRNDGRVERISTKAAGVVLNEGEVFETRCGSSGGVGDPLRRLPQAVAEDVADRFITAVEALTVYGVVLREDGTPDAETTDTRRAAQRADRLARATPPVQVFDDKRLDDLGQGEEFPLYPGIVQRGAVAYVKSTGTPLTVAPHHWTEGCAILEEARSGGGPALVNRMYLDPRTGVSLYVEVVPPGEPRSFEIMPTRWTRATRAQS
jgi:N-methylhydantoinase B